MTTSRKIEVFTAGGPACDETVAQVQQAACPSCDITLLDSHQRGVATRAKALGILSVPAVVIDGKLADCCADRGPKLSTLQAAGLGQPLA